MFCLLGIVFCCFAKTSDRFIGDVVEPNPISARGQSEFAVLLERAEVRLRFAHVAASKQPLEAVV
jgi:hypothetical protein